MGFRDGLVNRIDEEESAALERMPTMEEVREVVCDGRGGSQKQTNFTFAGW